MNITIRRGAAHHDMTIIENGETTFIDFSEITKEQRYAVRKALVQTLTARGLLNVRNGHDIGRRKGKSIANRRRNKRAVRPSVS